MAGFQNTSKLKLSVRFSLGNKVNVRVRSVVRLRVTFSIVIREFSRDKMGNGIMGFEPLGFGSVLLIFSLRMGFSQTLPCKLACAQIRVRFVENVSWEMRFNTFH